MFFTKYIAISINVIVFTNFAKIIAEIHFSELMHNTKMNEMSKKKDYMTKKKQILSPKWQSLTTINRDIGKCLIFNKCHR